MYSYVGIARNVIKRRKVSKLQDPSSSEAEEHQRSDAWRCGALQSGWLDPPEIEPADVGTPGVAMQIALPVLVHAEIIRREILEGQHTGLNRTGAGIVADTIVAD